MSESLHSPGIGLVGIDMANQARRRNKVSSLPWIIVGIVAALFVVGLRIDLTRVGYARAAALEEEQSLRVQKRALTVEMRRLRNHIRLAEEARIRGFEQPSSIIDLPIPALPSVAAAAGSNRELRP